MINYEKAFKLLEEAVENELFRLAGEYRTRESEEIWGEFYAIERVNKTIIPKVLKESEAT